MQKNILDVNTGALRSLISEIIIETLEYYCKYNTQTIKELLQNSTSPVENNNLLTVKEACAMLKCSRATLHRYRTQAELSFIKRGKNVLFQKAEIESLLKKVTLRKF
jgi:excisionase family DNA binding protein